MSIQPNSPSEKASVAVLAVGLTAELKAKLEQDFPELNWLEANQEEEFVRGLLSERAQMLIVDSTHAGEMFKRDGRWHSRLIGAGVPGILLVSLDELLDYTELVPASWEVLPNTISYSGLSRRVQWYLENTAHFLSNTVNLSQPGMQPGVIDEHLELALEIGGLSTFEYDLATLRMIRGERRFESFAQTPKDLKEVFSMVHPEDRARTMMVIENAGKTGGFAQSDYRILSASGQYRWVRTMGRVVGRNEHHPGRMIGITFDIHESKLAQYQLTRVSDELQVALEGTRLNPWRRNLLTDERFHGPLDEEFFGQQLDSPDDFWACVHPEDRAKMQGWIEDGVTPPDRQKASEFRAKHSDGTWHWYSSYARVTFNDQLQPEWLIGVTWDITQRKQNELAAIESEQRLVETLQAAKMISWEYDLITRERRSWGADEKVLGFVPSSIEQVLERIHPDDLENHREQVDRIQRGYGYKNEFRLRIGDEWRWIYSTGSPVFDKSGGVIAARGVTFDVTEQKVQQQARIDSEARLLEALDSARMISWDWDLITGKRTSWGSSLREIGADPQTIEQADNVVHPDDQKRDREMVDAAIANGTLYENEFRIVTGAGDVRWLFSRGRVLRDAAGNATHLRGVAFDVTDRRENEIRLAAVEDRLQRAVNAAKMVCWEWDLQSGMRESTGCNEEIFGFVPNSTDQIDRIIHPDDFEEDERRFNEAFEQGNEYRSEFRIIRPDGEVRWLMSRGSPIADAQGKTQYFAGVVWDITQRKETEHTLQRSLEWLQLAVVGAGVNTWTINLLDQSISGSVDQKYMGFAPQTFGGVYELMEEESQKRYEAALYSAVSNNNVFRERVRIIKPDGQAMWLEVVGKPNYDESGIATEISGVSFDVTQEENRKKELQDALEQTRLAMDSKSRFFASMSHEIRTPLNGVVGAAQLLRQTRIDGSQAELLHTLENSAEQLLSVINDVLDFTKIESGQMPISEEAFSLAQCLDSAVSMIAAQAAEKKLSLINTWRFPPGILLMGDDLRLKQILLNLLSNAVKFTFDGYVAIEVDYDDALKKLFICVKDSGIGISEEARQRLFTPFWQGDASMTRRFGGTGLGLTITRQLVEIMKGEIRLENVDQGTCFVVEIPFGQADGSSLQMPLTNSSFEILVCGFPAAMQSAFQQQFVYWNWRSRTVETLTELIEQNASAGSIVLISEAMAMEQPELFARAKQQYRIIMVQPYHPLSQLAAEEKSVLETVRYPVLPVALASTLDDVLYAQNQLGLHIHVPIESEQVDENLRVLIAEDNEVNQFLLLAMLENFGLMAEAVGDGFAAVSACHRSAFDIVLMDVEMPLMSGLEATQLIRAKKDQHQPYIVAVTAHVLPESREKILLSGVDDIVHKPVMAEQLKAALLRAQQSLKNRTAQV